MDLRIFTEPQQGATYDDLLRVARATEAAGFDAFFRSDHYLRWATATACPGPPTRGHLGRARPRDQRIRLGTLVTAATFRHPGPLAISVAQVDQMSGGRVEFGLGAAGSRRSTPPTASRSRRRGALRPLEEQLEIITGLWKTPVGEMFSFSGDHYTVVDSPALPKPAQSPAPPVIIGGGGKKRTPALAARFADEFNLPFASPEAALAQFERVAAAAEAVGRDPKEILRLVALTVAIGRDDAEVARRAGAISRDLGELRESGLAGTAAQVVDRIGQWREKTGITRLYLQVLDLQDLDHLEFIASDVAPQLWTHS